MEKKIYISPLLEVTNVSLTQCLLDGSPVEDQHPTDLPLGPAVPAPARQTPAF